MQQTNLKTIGVNDRIQVENPVLDSLSQFMDKNAITELVESFSKRSSQHIEKAIYSIENYDVENLRFAIHTLKGSSANVGLLNLSSSCESTEKYVKAHDKLDVAKVKEELKVIAGLLEDGKQELQNYIDKL